MDLKTATATGDPRIVLAAITGKVPACEAGYDINWDDITFIYGERFKEATLARYTYFCEKENNFKVILFVVAPDVTNPGRVIAQCALEEARAREIFTDEKNNARFFYDDKFELSEYIKVCDPVLLFKNGVVVVQENTGALEIEHVLNFLSDEEKTELAASTQKLPQSENTC